MSSVRSEKVKRDEKELVETVRRCDMSIEQLLKLSGKNNQCQVKEKKERRALTQRRVSIPTESLYSGPRMIHSSYRLTPPPTPTILPPTQHPDTNFSSRVINEPAAHLPSTAPIITSSYATKIKDLEIAALGRIERIRTSKDGSVIAISCDGSMAFSYLSRVSHKSYWMREQRLRAESQLCHCINRIKLQVGAVAVYLLLAGVLRLYLATV